MLLSVSNAPKSQKPARHRERPERDARTVVHRRDQSWVGSESPRPAATPHVRRLILGPHITAAFVSQNSKAPLGSPPRVPRRSFEHGLVNLSKPRADTPETSARRASEREGVEAMMRSQLHAAVSPPPSLRRALPSVTPRALRYAAAHRLACSDPLSSFLFCGATADSERIAPPLSASRFHAFPGRFRVHRHGRGVGARRAGDPPGNTGSVNRLLCHGLACHFAPPAPCCLQASFVLSCFIRSRSAHLRERGR